MSFRVVHIVLCCLLLTGCGNIRQAQQTVATADSLDTEHILYRDTTALCHVVRTLDKPFVRQCHRTTLAKAYYYLGRNYSAENLISVAADCYIASDKLYPHDYILRGRVNSCMGFICGQQCKDSVALIFYRRATEHFEKSGNEWRYAQSLLNVVRRLIDVHHFHEADSIWQIANTFQLDSVYLARLYETRGLYYDEQQMYDSALVWLLKIEHFPLNNTDKCSAYIKIMQAYDTLYQVAQAEPYAKYVVEHSDIPNFVSNACYCMIANAQKRRDADEVAYYSYIREDNSRLIREEEGEYVLALLSLTDYLKHPYKTLIISIIISAVALCLIMIVLLFFRYRKRKNQTIHTQQHINTRQSQDIVEYRVKEKVSYFDCKSSIWRNYPIFYETADKQLIGIATRLSKQYHLSQRDIQICIATLYEFSARDTAFALNCAQSSIGKLKSNTAKKLGTTSKNLRLFLLNLLTE